MPRYKFNPQSASRPTPQALTCTLALAFLLGGCASQPATPSATSAATTDAASSNPDIANPLAQWWQRFNDPVMSQLITQALQANTSVRSAHAALQQSRALRDVKNASLLPNLSASGSAQRGKSGGLEASNSFRVGLDASWEPDIFGGNRSNLNAAEADAKAFEASLADVQVSVAAEVALVYIQLRGQQAQLGIALDNLANQKEV
ncbi:MAG: TolC family protein, partial [Rhodoferax sp.]|nr:TolC family protein [Rhodoferax sp.]